MNLFFRGGKNTKEDEESLHPKLMRFFEGILRCDTSTDAKRKKREKLKMQTPHRSSARRRHRKKRRKTLDDKRLSSWQRSIDLPKNSRDANNDHLKQSETKSKSQKGDLIALRYYSSPCELTLCYNQREPSGCLALQTVTCTSSSKGGKTA